MNETNSTIYIYICIYIYIIYSIFVLRSDVYLGSLCLITRQLRPEDFKDFKENVKLPPPKTSKFARLAQQASAASRAADLEADLLDDAPDSSELGGTMVGAMVPWLGRAGAKKHGKSPQFKDVRISWKEFLTESTKQFFLWPWHCDFFKVMALELPHLHRHGFV